MNYHLDNVIKFRYNEKINVDIEDLEIVGATDKDRVIDISNGIYVKKDGDDDTGDGTIDNPYKTINKAASQCTEDIDKVVILDSEEYKENSIKGYTYLKSIVSANNHKPVLKCDTSNSKGFTIPLEAIVQNVVISNEYTFGTEGITVPIITKQLKNGDIFVTFIHYGQVGEYWTRIYNVILDRNLNIKVSSNLIWENINSYNTITNTPIGYEGIELDDGIVIFWGLGKSNVSATTALYYCICNKENGNLIGSVQTLVTYANTLYAPRVFNTFHLNENNWGIFYRDEANINYQQGLIKTFNFYSLINTMTIKEANRNYYVIPEYNSDKYLLFLPVSSTQPFIRTYDKNGTLVESYPYTYMEYDQHDYVYFYRLRDNDNIIGHRNLDPNKGHRIFDKHLQVIPGYNRVLRSSDYTEYKPITFINNKMTLKAGSTCQLLDIDGTVLSEGSYNNLFNYAIPGSYNTSEDDFIIATVQKQLQSGKYAVVLNKIKSYYSEIINTNNNFITNGIIYDGDNNPHVKALIYSLGGINSKYCTYRNNYYNINNTRVITSYPIYSVGDSIIYNSYFIDGHTGIYIESNNIDFYRNVIARYKYGSGLCINGNGNNVIINHNIFHNNYAGVRFLNNDGQEIVKNNVLYDNINYGLSADVSLTIFYSLCTDNIINIIFGQGVITLNPRFINDGYINPQAIDLHYKSIAMGYVSNSPAIGASDTGIDLGAYNTSYIYLPSTYDEIIVEQPKVINIEYVPVNDVKHIMYDGTIKTYKEGITRYLELVWEGMLNSDYDNIMKLYSSNSENIYIYLSPVSLPDEYITCVLEYNKINGSPKLRKLSRTGVSDVKLTFAMKYE